MTAEEKLDDSRDEKELKDMNAHDIEDFHQLKRQLWRNTFIWTIAEVTIITVYMNGDVKGFSYREQSFCIWWVASLRYVTDY